MQGAVQDEDDDEQSEWVPQEGYIPKEATWWLNAFCQALKPLFIKQKVTPNLLSFQNKLLCHYCQDKSILLVNTDQGLGPAAIKYDWYVQDALGLHLNDKNKYQQLTTAEVDEDNTAIGNAIWDWTDTFEHDIGNRYAYHQIPQSPPKRMQEPFCIFLCSI